MADIQLANTDSDLSGNTVVTEENAYTITGLHTFSRSTNAPFACISGAAVVTYLDADKLDGQEGAYYLAAANFTGTLAVNRGGTGAATLTDGGVLLGSGTSAITAMSVLANSEMIVGNGSTDPVAESGATLRTSIGVGTGDTLQLTGIELGHATDTTLVRSSSGNVSIEGNVIYRAGGTDVAVADGGTGASSLTDGGVLLGSGTGAITATAVLGDGVILIGDASGDPTTLDVGSSTGITILGTVATGTWQGTAVADTYVANDLTISGGTVNNSVIGGSTAAAGSFTTLATSDTGTTSIDVAGGITAGTGNVALVGTDGKINGPLSSTIIDDLSGANLTTLNASNVSSGTLANARLPTNVDLGGTLDVTGAATFDSDVGIRVTPTGGDLCIDAAESSTPTIRFENDQGTVDGSIDSWTSASNIQLWIGANEYLNSGSLARFNASYDTAAIELTAEGVINLRTGDDATSTTRLSVDKAGAVAVAGALSKGSGSFRISHPLPAKNATHELVHSFIEGPQCDLIYRGTVILVAGAATVNLDTVSNMTDGTWVILCHGAQCFTSNETGWSSVRGSVSGNLLTIECEVATSTDTISWMVVAERQDDHILETAWTDDAGRPIVEPPVAS
jgi:hypothetical protein